ncbi:hypothetical protein [Legionella sainthelensi]|uniref:Uncharacterized protein n=1 Tax=Legionella sainthelensi TaxID=28087 RepID=A0A2H5FM48_9GAMM|nr:hypothetical protein [Legionella sainthelensi]AUH72612.1 hypothetical protein CAB17_11520 [Legionella sainthelensi]
MKQNDIYEIIDMCRIIARKGTSWFHSSVEIPELVLDFRPSSYAFLGKGNPAIFVNSKTFQLTVDTRAQELKEGHSGPQWVENRTLVLSEDIVAPKNSFGSMLIIGIIIHETGHAYNLAAGLKNTESNAYLFEIEILCHMHENKMLYMQDNQLADYFTSRMPQYQSGLKTNPHLSKMISNIAIKFDLNIELNYTNLLNIPNISGNQLATNRGTFFGFNGESGANKPSEQSLEEKTASYNLIKTI